MVDLDEYLGRGSRKRTKEKDASATRPSFVLNRPLGRVRATREHRNANRRPGASPSRRESNEYDDFGAGATGGGGGGRGGGGESGASGGRLCTRGTNQPTDIRSYIRGNIELWKEI